MIRLPRPFCSPPKYSLTKAVITDAGAATGLPGEVTLLDLNGRVVRTLWQGTFDRLTFDVPFVARDAQGRALAPGVYLLVVRLADQRAVSRVAVIR